MKPLAPTDLAFFDTAPVQLCARFTLPADPVRVFAALADPAGWTSWFPGMYAAAWTSPQVACLGAERLVKLKRYGDFLERMIAWEPGRRFAFTMVGTTSPMARALAEDYRLSDGPSGTTTIDWCMATTPSGLGRAAMPVMKPIMRRMFTKAGAGLARYLGAHDAA
jgi:uncharacterized protein YndB with AHSA1/START domain